MKAYKHYLIWGLIVLVLSIHYLRLTGHLSNTCKKDLFNCEGLGELVFMEAGGLWMLVIIQDSEDWIYHNRYFDGVNFLTQESSVYLAKDTCELKRLYIKRFEKGSRTWPVRTGKVSKRLHE